MAPCSGRLRKLLIDFNSPLYLDLRLELAEKLGILGIRGIPLLLESLDDPHIKVCRASAWALENAGEPQPIPHLFVRSENRDIKIISVWSELSEEVVLSIIVPALLQRLQDERWWVRQATAKALGRIADPQTVQALCLALEDKDWSVRRAAAEALGRIGDTSAITPLCYCLGDEVEEVRRTAAEALGEIGDRKALSALQEAYARELKHEIKAVIKKSIEKILYSPRHE